MPKQPSSSPSARQPPPPWHAGPVQGAPTRPHCRQRCVPFLPTHGALSQCSTLLRNAAEECSSNTLENMVVKYHVTTCKVLLPGAMPHSQAERRPSPKCLTRTPRQ